MTAAAGTQSGDASVIESTVTGSGWKGATSQSENQPPSPLTAALGPTRTVTPVSASSPAPKRPSASASRKTRPLSPARCTDGPGTRATARRCPFHTAEPCITWAPAGGAPGAAVTVV